MKKYKLSFNTYSGMTFVIGEEMDREDAEDEVGKRNAAARGRGQPVIRLRKNRWEHGEEDDCGMIGDHHGVLRADRVRKPSRR